MNQGPVDGELCAEKPRESFEGKLVKCPPVKNWWSIKGSKDLGGTEVLCL